MNNTTKVATATAGIIAIAWMFAKRVSKNRVNEKTTRCVAQLPPDIAFFENMSLYNQQFIKFILDDIRKAEAEAKAQGKRFILVDPFGKDLTPWLKHVSMI